MPLAIDFHFNQNNLQDFLDCPRRFELRHILRQQWPALKSEPVLEQEHQMVLGNRFHEMVRQSSVGISADQIEAQVDEPQLLEWWHNFLAEKPVPENATFKAAEIMLSAVLANARLVAKIDLLVVTAENQVVIYDWKTSLNRPSSHGLRSRMQTRLYPYLVAKAARFGNSPTLPNQIQIVYWFTNSPKHPEHIAYSQEQLESDETYISNLIQEIRKTPTGEFLLTPDERKCAYCTYRSLCNRGIEAGDWLTRPGEDEENPPDLVIDFENIAEIEF